MSVGCVNHPPKRSRDDYAVLATSPFARVCGLLAMISRVLGFSVNALSHRAAWITTFTQNGFDEQRNPWKV